MISQKAIDLIVQFEVGSKALYEKKYQRPEWPGGASGITVGIGYDLGYQTKAKIVQDWASLVDVDTLKALQSCAGIKAEVAHNVLATVRPKILIPWASAMKVFLERDVPVWTDHVLKMLPGAEKLFPDSLGALVSLAYNRGASFNLKGDRYTEMRNIKLHLKNGELNKIGNDIREMKRLWPNMKGLRDRRDLEAKLFEQGLKPVVVVPPLVTVTTAVGVGAAAGIVAAPVHWVPYVIIGASLLAIVSWVGVHYYNKWKANKNVVKS